jgi:hypothetical protein
MGVYGMKYDRLLSNLQTLFASILVGAIVGSLLFAVI